MTTITICKVAPNKLDGFDERSRKSYAKFRKVIDGLGLGECLSFSYWFPRSPKFHKRHMAIIGAICDAQEQFDEYGLRMYLQTGAGFCTYVPGPLGKMIAIPKSIAWDKLDDAEFQEHHEKVMAFARSERCTNFLWPHLSQQEQMAMIEGILEQFEQPA